MLQVMDDVIHAYKIHLTVTTTAQHQRAQCPLAQASEESLR